MMNCGKVMFGVIVGVTTALTIKVAYEYGRYSAVHDIYKRGWSVVRVNEDDEKETKKGGK